MARASDRVAIALRELGIEPSILHLPDSTRTVADAARTIGCTEDEILKSIVFRDHREAAVVVLSMGQGRIDTNKLESLLGGVAKKADAAWVKETTGYPIGGVPPVGHGDDTVVLLDQSALTHVTVWAAAGHPQRVMTLPVQTLLKCVTQVVDISCKS